MTHSGEVAHTCDGSLDRRRFWLPGMESLRPESRLATRYREGDGARLGKIAPTRVPSHAGPLAYCHTWNVRQPADTKSQYKPVSSLHSLRSPKTESRYFYYEENYAHFINCAISPADINGWIVGVIWVVCRIIIVCHDL